VIRALSKAIETIKAGRHDPIKAHERVKGMYAWSDIAQRTEVVYYRAMESERKDTFERLTRYVLFCPFSEKCEYEGYSADDVIRVLSLGPVFGPVLCCIMAVQHWFFWFLEWYDPRAGIDLVEDHWTAKAFEKQVHMEKGKIDMIQRSQ
jgi:phosphatidylinositol glycan class A protein